jgi:hypothetical protein
MCQFLASGHHSIVRGRLPVRCGRLPQKAGLTIAITGRPLARRGRLPQKAGLTAATSGLHSPTDVPPDQSVGRLKAAAPLREDAAPLSHSILRRVTVAGHRLAASAGRLSPDSRHQAAEAPDQPTVHGAARQPRCGVSGSCLQTGGAVLPGTPHLPTGIKLIQADARLLFRYLPRLALLQLCPPRFRRSSSSSSSASVSSLGERFSKEDMRRLAGLLLKKSKGKSK